MTCSEWVMKVQYYPTHKIVIVSSSNKDNLISFHNCILYLTWLSVLVKTLSSLLNINDESRNPCLVLDFSGNDLSIFLHSMTLTVNLLYVAFIVLIHVLCTRFSRALIIKRCWVLSKAFSVSNEMILCFLSLNLFIW